MKMVSIFSLQKNCRISFRFHKISSPAFNGILRSQNRGDFPLPLASEFSIHSINIPLSSFFKSRWYSFFRSAFDIVWLLLQMLSMNLSMFGKSCGFRGFTHTGILLRRHSELNGCICSVWLSTGWDALLWLLRQITRKNVLTEQGLWRPLQTTDLIEKSLITACIVNRVRSSQPNTAGSTQ